MTGVNVSVLKHETIVIRQATHDDVPAMMTLAADADTAAHWSPDIYARIFSPDAPARLALVLATEQEQNAGPGEPGPARIIGFVVAISAGPEWEIENVVISPLAHGRGLGTRLMSELLQRARRAGAESVFLEVRESNRAARALYEKCGFTIVARRGAYYADPVEDAIVYQYGLNGRESDESGQS